LIEKTNRVTEPWSPIPMRETALRSRISRRLLIATGRKNRDARKPSRDFTRVF